MESTENIEIEEIDWISVMLMFSASFLIIVLSLVFIMREACIIFKSRNAKDLTDAVLCNISKEAGGASKDYIAMTISHSGIGV